MLGNCDSQRIHIFTCQRSLRLAYRVSHVLYVAHFCLQAVFSDFLRFFYCLPESRFPPFQAMAAAPILTFSQPAPALAENQWRRPGSNRQPLACKASALPVELRPRCPLRGKLEARISNLETLRRPAAARFGCRTSCFGFPLTRRSKAVGPGRVELPTSRLSGVRSHQLSYEPLIQLRLCENRLASIGPKVGFYTCSVHKEQQKKPLLFSASGSGTFIQATESAVKASVFELSVRVSNLLHLAYKC
jgi:hypothetical protein